MKVKVGDITKIKTGKLDANASSTDGKYPFFTCSKEPLKIDTYSYDCECVLVAGNGDLNVKYYNGKFDAYQRTYIIEDNSNGLLYVPYLYYFLEGYIEELRKQSIGGVIKYIKLDNLTDALIELPSVEEQKYIVNLMNTSSELIDLRRETINKLDSLVKARFVEMFGNIKENRFIKCKMREVAHIKHGYAYSGEYFSDKDNGVVLVTPGNFALGGGFQEIKNKYFTSKYPEEYVLHPGDLIVTMTDLSKKADTLGYGAIIPDNTSKIYLHNQRIGLFDELDKRLNPVFVRWFMQTDEYRLEIVRTSTGSTVHHTSPDRILDSLIFLPPIQLQNDFVKFANQVNKSKVILPKPPFNVII